jgi:tetratricopeptide (TPR) repeat protein
MFKMIKFRCVAVVTALIMLIISPITAQQDSEDTATALDLDVDSIQVVVDGNFHYPGEILVLLEQSDLMYSMYTDGPDTSENEIDPPVLTSDYYRVLQEDGSIVLYNYSVSDSVMLLLAASEGAFEAEAYNEAIEIYKSILELEPGYHQMLVWIGQCFGIELMTDSARYYYELAIERNYIDYNAHWFLGDLVWNQGDTLRALQELTLAHILNVNHELIRERLWHLRKMTGRSWEEWSFRPRYSLSDSGHNVEIKAEIQWMWYAMVKALWKYEPGYSENMTGRPHSDALVNFLEEKEALGVWTLSLLDESENTDDTLANRLKRVMQDGFLNEFIYYERVAPFYPAVMLPLSEEVLLRIGEYVNRYH